MAEVAREKAVDPARLEIWFADEARVGQKNKITRRWARLAQGSVRRSRMEGQDEGRRGTRPAAPYDQRTASAYIFGAICPKTGTGAALVLPRCNTAAMNLHLAEIATTVARGGAGSGRIRPPCPVSFPLGFGGTLHAPAGSTSVRTGW